MKVWETDDLIKSRHKTIEVLQELRRERDAQREKWGQQNHPWSVGGEGPGSVGSGGDHACSFHAVPTESIARRRVEIANQHGYLTFADILMEEVAEAVAADTVEEARQELVQVAAVAVAAIETIDRRDRAQE